MFSFLCKTIIENPQKMTARKFYGCHFHCMVVHAPQTHRIFCLRSLVQELEERSFCDLRRISLNISNQQCGKVIENIEKAILGFNTQQQTDRGESYRKQETIISNESASKISATVRGHQIFIRNLTKSSLLIPDSLPEDC